MMKDIIQLHRKFKQQTLTINDMNTTNKFVIGLAAAAAAGAVIGMLFAPEKGKDLQKRLANGTKDWLAELGSLLDIGKDVVSKVKKNSEEVVDDFGAQLKEVSKN
jgi:gas vesicle protein